MWLFLEVESPLQARSIPHSLLPTFPSFPKYLCNPPWTMLQQLHRLHLGRVALVASHLRPQPFPRKQQLHPRCSNSDDGEGDGPPPPQTDWDRAWTSFKKSAAKKNQSKKARKGSGFTFDTDKYVSWNPRRSEYPLSEEVDPIRRTERSNLAAWTSTTFTLFGAAAIISLLIIYTLLAPPNK